MSYNLTLLNLINALTMNVNKYINRFIVSDEMETLLIRWVFFYNYFTEFSLSI